MNYSYRFPRAEPGGLLGTPFAPAQVLVFAGGCLLGLVWFLRTAGSQFGFFSSLTILLLSGVVAISPIAGRSAIEWAPILLRAKRRERRWRAPRTTRAHLLNSNDLGAGSLPPTPEPPPGVEDVELYDVAVTESVSIGVLIDRKAGTYTAAIQCRAGAHQLLGDDEKAQRLAGYGRVLAVLAREGTPVGVVQWIEGTAVSDVHDLVRYYSENRDPAVPLHSRTAQNLLRAMDSAPASTQDHDIHVVIQIDAKRAGRAIATLAGGQGNDIGACRVLVQELRQVQAGLSAIDVEVQGALTARSLGRLVHEAYDPTSRQQYARADLMNPASSGVPEHGMWPTDVLEEPSSYRTDGTWHRTLSIVEFPSDAQGLDFLKPLMLETTRRRRVSIVMRPIPPSKAKRDLRAAQTALRGNKAIKAKITDESVDDIQRAEDLNAQAWELRDGHGDYQYAGFVTVSAPSQEELEEAVYEVTTQAMSSGSMQLRPTWFEQAEAFTYTLPFGRGLS